MNKFLFIFSIVVFLVCLALLIKNIVGVFNWVSLTVAIVGMISAVLAMLTSRMLKQLNQS